jgi:hypothetical protein
MTGTYCIAFVYRDGINTNVLGATFAVAEALVRT